MPKIPESLTSIVRNKKECRDKATRVLYDRRWSKARRIFLMDHPLCECEDCEKFNKLKTANVVHHVKAHKGNYDLFWDENNWQALNKYCHDRITGIERR